MEQLGVLRRYQGWIFEECLDGDSGALRGRMGIHRRPCEQQDLQIKHETSLPCFGGFINNYNYYLLLFRVLGLPGLNATTISDGGKAIVCILSSRSQHAAGLRPLWYFPLDGWLFQHWLATSASSIPSTYILRILLHGIHNSDI